MNLSQYNWTEDGLYISLDESGNYSQNNILFTAVVYALYEKMLDEKDKSLFALALLRLQPEPGVFYRKPVGIETVIEQEQHDDYRGILLGCVLFKDTKTPRNILKYLVKNFGFMNSKQQPRNKAAFLGRHIDLWLYAIPCAFPITRFLFFPLFFVLNLWNKRGLSSGDGVQLGWLQAHTFKLLGFSPWYDEFMKALPEGFKKYYGEESPQHKRALELNGESNA